MIEPILTAIIATAFVMLLIWAIVRIVYQRTHKSQKSAEVDPENITALAEYVKAQKEQAEQQQNLKELKRIEQKQKLEHFKQTQDQLKEKLRTQFDAKQWTPLQKILSSADKGGIGVYVLYNATKNKYYVGQAKQIYKRIRDHFQVEDIARDFLNGDNITATFLTANELGEDYRMDHIERVGIDLFDAEKSGYNKKQGSI